MSQNNPQGNNVTESGFTAAEDWFGDMLMNSWMGQLFLPGLEQRIEFGQQVGLQREQNEWNSVENQVERWKNAGLNPQSFVQQNSQSVSSAPSAVGSGQGAAQALVGAANAVTGGAASLADAAFKTGTLEPTIENIKSQSAVNLKSLGLTDLQIEALQVDNSYRRENWENDLRLKELQQDNLRQEWKVMEADYQLKSQMVDTELERLNLMVKQENNLEAQTQYFEVQKQKVQVDKEWQQNRLDLAKKYQYDIEHSSVDNILFSKVLAGEDITALSNGYIAYIRQYNDAVEGSKAAASWQYRPESYAAIISDAVNQSTNLLAPILEKGVSSLTELRNNAKAYAEFKEKYHDARTDLYQRYREARNRYNEYKHTGVADSYKAQLKQAMQFAKEEYENYTEDKYLGDIVAHFKQMK